MVKISQYTSISTLADEDLFDTSQYDPVALDYNTRSISYEDMIESIKTSIYTSTTVDAAASPGVGNNRTVFYSATAPGSMSLPLPIAGRMITFVRIANGGTAATIATTGPGVLINGAALFATDTTLYSIQTAHCDGTNWFIA